MPFDGTGYRFEANELSFGAELFRMFRRKQPPSEPDSYITDNPALAVLLIGRSLIENRKGWVQRRYETKDGRYCVVGALRFATKAIGLPAVPPEANSALMNVAWDRGFNDIESMNDNSPHRKVLSAFNDAIALARTVGTDSYRAGPKSTSCR
jgi:hypothetical protein